MGKLCETVGSRSEVGVRFGRGVEHCGDVGEVNGGDLREQPRSQLARGEVVADVHGRSPLCGCDRGRDPE
jgi:hypothetical protein